jgi:hypothetical protein
MLTNEQKDTALSLIASMLDAEKNGITMAWTSITNDAWLDGQSVQMNSILIKVPRTAIFKAHDALTITLISAEYDVLEYLVKVIHLDQLFMRL